MPVTPLFMVPVGLDVLFELLDKISLFKNKQYMIDPTSFNKMMYMGLYNPFIEVLKKHYSPSKNEILFREANYHNFMMIIKQICKYHHLKITTKTQSANSTKHLVYFINFEKEVSLIKNPITEGGELKEVGTGAGAGTDERKEGGTGRGRGLEQGR
jgi:hypothetical protein